MLPEFQLTLGHTPRLARTAHGHVTFPYTPSRTHETRHLSLPVAAFLDRFLQHVLPPGFAKIRAYGLLSPSRKAALERTRDLLERHAARATPPTVDPPDPPCLTAAGADAADLAWRCAQCHGLLARVGHLARARAPPCPDRDAALAPVTVAPTLPR